MRADNRKPDELREVKITRNYTKYAEGSVLVEFGDTKVLCNATVTNEVPPFLKGQKTGWITAEYAMIPRSSDARIVRDSVKGKISGRSHEIQRLIGRSLRSVIDMKKLGERTIIIDADVLQADGGTRTAAIMIIVRRISSGITGGAGDGVGENITLLGGGGAGMVITCGGACSTITGGTGSTAFSFTMKFASVDHSLTAGPVARTFQKYVLPYSSSSVMVKPGLFTLVSIIGGIIVVLALKRNWYSEAPATGFQEKEGFSPRVSRKAAARMIKLTIAAVMTVICRPSIGIRKKPAINVPRTAPRVLMV